MTGGRNTCGQRVSKRLSQQRPAPERIRHPKEGRFACIAPTPASRPAHHKWRPTLDQCLLGSTRYGGEYRRSALGECSLDA
ncbi:hypothetical protein B0H10DRAFT_1826529 [Mycena sp. CBHHK59/15]|nr:hypothetical protein B0H10DRAFT_1826529 [Mycena sp. CBHHK59/15]